MVKLCTKVTALLSMYLHWQAPCEEGCLSGLPSESMLAVQLLLSDLPILPWRVHLLSYLSCDTMSGHGWPARILRHTTGQHPRCVHRSKLPLFIMQMGLCLAYPLYRVININEICKNERYLLLG